MSRIGILVYDASATGGAERVAKNLANEFSKKDKTFLISLFATRDVIVSESTDVVVVEKKVVSITKNFIQIRNKLRKILMDNNIQILIAITAGVVTQAVAASHNINVKVVYSEHSNLENKTYGIKHQIRQRLGAKKSDKVVTLTKRDKDNFIRFFHIPSNKVIAIPNWYTPCNKGYQYDDSSKKIISVGRLEQVKGYDYAIDVAGVLAKKYPEWHWDIYGEGTWRERLQQRINREGLNDFMSLKGNVNNLSDIYHQYSFLVMTSLYEGLPMSLLEAQSCKLPIVSFDCPTGPSEIVRNNVNGFLIKPYDTERMQKKISELIENSDERESFSKNSQLNLPKFDKGRVLTQWNCLFDTLLNGTTYGNNK